MSDFDPAAAWDAAAPRLFPDQEVRWNADGYAIVRCPLGCGHKSGDTGRPSLSICRHGGFRCLAFGRNGSLRDLVLAVLGEQAWVEIGRAGAGPGGGPREKESLEAVWNRMGRETAWTERYMLDPELARRWLRGGARWPGDLLLDTTIALRDGDRIVGLKSRLPAGRSWTTGNDRQGKYRAAPGSKSKGVLFAPRDPAAWPDAAVVVVAGEKDALVAASHLPPARWCPVSGVAGEGTLPPIAPLVGRRVVIAYDPDPAGRSGAAKLWRALEGKAAELRVAVFPEDDAGAPVGEGKWDAAAVVLAGGLVAVREGELSRGGARLQEILEAALPELPAGWVPAGQAPGAGDPPSRPEAGERAGPGPRVEDPLSGWRVVNGQLVELVGDGKHAKLVLRFDGVPSVTRVETRWAEDPETPGSWVEEQRQTYRVNGAAGPPRTYAIAAGQAPFAKMLDEHFAGACYCYTFPERARLWQWAHRSSAPEKAEVRRAIGPSGAHGWLCAPSWSVREGRIERTAYTVEPPPGAANELRRYRLEDLPVDRLRELGRWVVDVLLRTDHHDGHLTLPLLGATLLAPVWHYVPTFATWQRYALFVQGTSGIGKTQLTRYFMSFWGDFVNPEGMSTWRDTAAAIEDLLHRCVGVPVLVSDWKKANFTRDAEKAARALLQSYGDRSARGRANLRAETQRRKEPRCQLILDGEDLPEGQESTLGRMVIVRATATEPTKRCATATAAELAPGFVRDMPGLTAAWIAWVQRNVPALTSDLEAAHAEVDELLPHGSTNRSRIVRNYAAQVLTVRSFGTFLEQLGVGPVVAELHQRSVEAHVAHGARQLETIHGESAGRTFMNGLVAALQSGHACLRQRGPAAGNNPFTGGSGASRCVGSYSRIDGKVELWPDAALPAVQSYVAQGGGERIEFSRDAILQQLKQDGIATARQSAARVDDGEGRKVRPRVWVMDLEDLGVEEEGGLFADSGAKPAQDEG
jgi:hypothetical protein